MLKQIASLSLLGCLGGLAALTACTGGVSLGKNPSANTAGDASGDGSTASGPYDITCSAGWRPAASGSEFENQRFAVRSDGTSSQTISWDGGRVSIDFKYAAATDNPDQADLTVTHAGTESSQVYRLSKTRRPISQFVGGEEGYFTGLNYVGGDIQYLCWSDVATRPVHQDAVVPMDAVCQVEVRSSPGGAVERRETYALKTPISTMIAAQTFTHDDITVTFTLSDDPYDARAINVSARKGAKAVSQLFQLDRNATLYNQLAGTTFSGRVALGTTGKEVSYACSSNASGGSSGNVCPTIADSCAAGCVTGTGQRFDPVRNCRDGDFDSIVTCTGPNPATTDIACSVRSDGVVVLGSGSLAGVTGFTRCDEELALRAQTSTTACTSAPLGKTCANGTNACDMSQCAIDELCYTQVSCGPAAPDGGGKGCTLGDSTPADNTCHKTCSDTSPCPAGQECVKKRFFACSDYDGYPDGRGICFAK